MVSVLGCLVLSDNSSVYLSSRLKHSKKEIVSLTLVVLCSCTSIFRLAHIELTYRQSLSKE